MVIVVARVSVGKLTALVSVAVAASPVNRKSVRVESRELNHGSSSGGNTWQTFLSVAKTMNKVRRIPLPPPPSPWVAWSLLLFCSHNSHLPPCDPRAVLGGPLCCELAPTCVFTCRGLQVAVAKRKSTHSVAPLDHSVSRGPGEGDGDSGVYDEDDSSAVPAPRVTGPAVPHRRASNAKEYTYVRACIPCTPYVLASTM